MYVVDISGMLAIPPEGWRPQRFSVVGRSVSECLHELAAQDALIGAGQQQKPNAGFIRSIGGLFLRIGIGGYSEAVAFRRDLIARGVWQGERTGSAPSTIFDLPQCDFLQKVGG